MSIRPAVKAQLLAEATHCAYCGTRLVDQEAVRERNAILGPYPQPQTHGWDDCPECRYATNYFARERLLEKLPGAWPQIDHRVPRSRGGSDEEWNLSVACDSCNQEKRERPLWAFLNEDRDDFGPAPSRLTAILKRRGPFGTGSLPHAVRRFLKEIAA